MKKTKKMVLAIFIIAIFTIFIASTAINATYSPNNFKGKITTTAAGTENVKTVGGKIVGLIQVVGTIVSVAMLVVLGIKYMVGSAEERAEYKKTLFPYIVGSVLIFGASNLAQVVYDWATAI